MVSYDDAQMAGAANPGLREENRKSSEHFVGSWTLVSFEHVPPSGEVLRPFGDSPTGLILFQPDGHMSAQLSVGSRTRLACDDPLQASPEAAAEAWRTYFGYWGSFAVDVEKRVVVHRVEGSSFSNWIGTEQVVISASKRAIDSFWRLNQSRGIPQRSGKECPIESLSSGREINASAGD